MIMKTACMRNRKVFTYLTFKRIVRNHCYRFLQYISAQHTSLSNHKRNTQHWHFRQLIWTRWSMPASVAYVLWRRKRYSKLTGERIANQRDWKPIPSVVGACAGPSLHVDHHNTQNRQHIELDHIPLSGGWITGEERVNIGERAVGWTCWPCENGVIEPIITSI